MAKQSLETQKKIGNLYAEDFGEIENKKNNTLENQSIPPVLEEENVISQDTLNEYYNKGFQDGLKKGKKEYDIEKEKINTGKDLKNYFISEILSIEEKIQNQEKKFYQEVIFTVLTCMQSVFPNLFDKYGIEESKIILQKFYPIINKNNYIKLNSSKEFFIKIEKLLPDFFKERLNFRVDETLKNGDFELHWDFGSLSRNANKYVEQITSEIMLACQRENRKNAGE
ncbi:hypothetical protein AD945_14675 [Gluconobacter albidus]|uniref:Flagellar assembly protein FliH/Type III secretion system HrpE domain-containing protein n=1 Tax=Gluconobacter albidus TaxID=318683 RepID=A0A149TF24_9PROT|nr:hypothetical protein [Gluconobacter albidus]KXV46223.1 hypothetical protein AD945_14675 [Gluconobacter albidus]